MVKDGFTTIKDMDGNNVFYENRRYFAMDNNTIS